MPTLYKCPKCGRTYNSLTQDGLCGDCTRPLEAVEIPAKTATGRAVFETTDTAERMEGLCVLVCDVSYSMDEAAFPSERPGLTKLRLVVDAVQSAVDAMANLTMAKNAYIAIIAFGEHARLITDQQGKLFIKSFQDILAEFAEPPAKTREGKQGKFAAFLQEKFESDSDNIDRQGTNVTEALRIARNLVDGAMTGDLSHYGFRGKISLIKHPLRTREGEELEVRNVRVMMYSDGVHNRGELRNAFEGMQPVSVLMTSFIGQPDQSAELRHSADDLKAMACMCPRHGHAGYFLVHKEARGELLRKVFRMATKASGFCTQCALEETDEEKKP